MTRSEIYKRYSQTPEGIQAIRRSANNYRKRHPDRVKEQRLRAKFKKYQIIAKLKQKPCFDCKGWFEPWQMDFDHRPGVEKRFEISDARRQSIPVLTEEIKKCDLVCSNCHRQRTYMRQFKKAA